MQSSLRHRSLVPALAVTAVVTLIACGAIKKHFFSEKARLIAEHAQTLKERERARSRERVDREVKALNAARERRREFDNQLEQAFGGPIAAASKNPDLTISESIEKIASLCAPRGSKVRVSVARFTEFTAIIELPRKLDDLSMAQITQCILGETSTYLNQVQFAHGGRIIAEIDRREIESVMDWRNISPAQIKTLLIDPGDLRIEVAASRSSASSGGNSVEERQNWSPEMRRQREAMDAFDATLKSAHKNFNASVEAQTQARDITGVRQAFDLIAKGRQLEQAEQLASEAKIILEDPAGAYAKILSAAAIDDTYQRASIRDAVARYQTSARAVHNVFAQNAETIRATSEYLEALSKHFANWTYNGQTKIFQFKSPDAHLAIKSAMERMEKADKNAAAAITEWNNAVAAQNNAFK